MGMRFPKNRKSKIKEFSDQWFNIRLAASFAAILFCAASIAATAFALYVNVAESDVKIRSANYELEIRIDDEEAETAVMTLGGLTRNFTEEELGVHMIRASVPEEASVSQAPTGFLIVRILDKDADGEDRETILHTIQLGGEENADSVSFRLDVRTAGTIVLEPHWGFASNEVYTDTAIADGTLIALGINDTFTARFEREDLLYRVGNRNPIRLGDLFKLAYGMSVQNEGLAISCENAFISADEDHDGAIGVVAALPDFSDLVPVTEEAEEVETAEEAETTEETAAEENGSEEEEESTWADKEISFAGTGIIRLSLTDGASDPCVLTLEVVDAKNVTEEADFILSEDAAEEERKTDLVLLSDIVLTAPVLVEARTLFGNGFTLKTFDEERGITGDGAYAGPEGLRHGYIDLVDGTVENLRLEAKIYPVSYLDSEEFVEEGDAEDKEYAYQLSGIAVSGESVIRDCYLYGGRNNVYVSGGQVRVERSELVSGAFSNLHFDASSETDLLLLTDVTTCQKPLASDFDPEKEMVGLGIVLGTEETEVCAELVIAGELRQYNEISLGAAEIAGFGNPYVKALAEAFAPEESGEATEPEDAGSSIPEEPADAASDPEGTEDEETGDEEPVDQEAIEDASAEENAEADDPAAEDAEETDPFLLKRILDGKEQIYLNTGIYVMARKADNEAAAGFVIDDQREEKNGYAEKVLSDAEDSEDIAAGEAPVAVGDEIDASTEDKPENAEDAPGELPEKAARLYTMTSESEALPAYSADAFLGRNSLTPVRYEICGDLPTALMAETEGYYVDEEGVIHVVVQADNEQGITLLTTTVAGFRKYTDQRFEYELTCVKQEEAENVDAEMSGDEADEAGEAENGEVEDGEAEEAETEATEDPGFAISGKNIAFTGEGRYILTFKVPDEHAYGMEDGELKKLSGPSEDDAAETLYYEFTLEIDVTVIRAEETEDLPAASGESAEDAETPEENTEESGTEPGEAWNPEEDGDKKEDAEEGTGVSGNEDAEEGTGGSGNEDAETQPEETGEA